LTNIDSSPFKQVSRVRVFEQAAEQIKMLVSSGYFSPGQKLPTEQELCEQLNVSRSTIRETLRVLEAEGIVEIRRGVGAYISTPGEKINKLEDLASWLHQREETLEQVLEVRESIEGLAASLAAKRITDQDLLKIRQLVEKQEEELAVLLDNPDSNLDQLAYLDMDFHLLISASCRNEIVSEIVNHIVPAFTESNKAVLYISRRMQRMVQEHQAVLQAIEAKNPREAEKAIRKHLEGVRIDILSAANLPKKRTKKE
jgi:GntR family transcriptional repressor for pyruvate dehydrogenase complex